MPVHVLCLTLPAVKVPKGRELVAEGQFREFAVTLGAVSGFGTIGTGGLGQSFCYAPRKGKHCVPYFSSRDDALTWWEQRLHDQARADSSASTLTTSTGAVQSGHRA